MTMRSYDALLLVSFGGPEGPDDVVPFLENVTRGRGIPRERLSAVGQHYDLFGGVSPINARCRDLLAAIRQDLDDSGVDLPVYWGNRNWDPYLATALQQMADDGVRRAIALVTSAYSSYSGCRQYREDLAAALAGVTGGPLRIDKLRHYFDHPGFVEPMVDATLSALSELPEGTRDRVVFAFTTHSLPLASAETSGPDGGAYPAQHREVARLVADGVAGRTGVGHRWELVYCSRSGSPGQPWLEPDINDALRRWQVQGAPGVVVVPIGFISDHMEVIYDLDTAARLTAEEVGLPMARAATVGTDPRFVAMVRELVVERDAVEAGESPSRRALGCYGVMHDVCPSGCCPNPRGPRPAVAGRD